MADWLLPTNSSLYTDYTSQNDARMDDLAVGLDPAVTTATNVPTNTVRWSGASSRWQKYNGTAWADLAATYQISISGNAGTATALQTARTINGVSFNGSANITLTANTPSSVTFNNAGAGAASGTTFNGGAALTVSYNTVGAPSTGGANASGTWNISVSGSAASLTTARNINGVSFNGSADVVVEPYVETDETTNADRFITFVDSSVTGYQRLNLNSGIKYNPSTNTLTVGTVAGNVSGNAGTATTLQTARTINGVSFNGSANITLTANTTNSITLKSDGTGAAANTTFNGSSAMSISYNSVGAPSSTGTGASGTWGISISGNAATATTASTTTGNAATATTAGYASNSDMLDGYHAASFVRSVSGIGPDGNGNVAVDLASRVAKTGDTMSGRLTMPSATISSTAPQIDFTDTDQGTTRYLHVNGNLMGFLNTGGGWDMYANNSGQVWTANYGWLHDYFFSTIANCASSAGATSSVGGVGFAGSLAINCYGTGSIIGGQRHELIDNGSQVQLRTVNYMVNCVCDCNC